MGYAISVENVRIGWFEGEPNDEDNRKNAQEALRKYLPRGKIIETRS
jgi:hypothetical protein